MTTTFFRCKFGCGKCFGVSWSNHRAAHHRSSYKIHFSLHVTIQLKHGSLLLCRIRENDTSKQWSFWFFIQLIRHPLLIFFTFPIYFKGQMTVAWTTLSSLTISCVVIRGSASMIAPSCQLLTASLYAPHHQGSCLLCKTYWTTPNILHCLLAVSSS